MRVLRLLGGYRNRLVYFYHEVSQKELYEICAFRPRDLERIHDALRRWLERNPQKLDHAPQMQRSKAFPTTQSSVSSLLSLGEVFDPLFGSLLSLGQFTNLGPQILHDPFELVKVARLYKIAIGLCDHLGENLGLILVKDSLKPFSSIHLSRLDRRFHRSKP